ncbi:MAG: zinc ribbon domain-containing protein [Candidatus Hodarchaeales archaeon]|jgi:hypothetical protein
MSNEVPKITPKFCGNCGQKLLEGATFCAYCGTPAPAVGTTGEISSKPSSPYIPTSPPFSGRGAPAYQAPYRHEKTMLEPDLPFVQHFQGVLISPQMEMPRIARRPNLSHSFLMVIITGIIAGVAMFILNEKTTIIYSDTFYESLGITGMNIDMEEYMEFMKIFLAFSAPIGFFISWFIGSIVLWIVQAIFSSQVPSHERNFKTMATIVGWSFLPRIFNELVRLAAFTFLVGPSTLEVNDIIDLAAVSAPLGMVGDILFFAEIIFLAWAVVLIYFAAKTIDPEGSHAVIIGIIYAVILFFIGF